MSQSQGLLSLSTEMRNVRRAAIWEPLPKKHGETADHLISTIIVEYAVFCRLRNSVMNPRVALAIFSDYGAAAVSLPGGAR